MAKRRSTSSTTDNRFDDACYGAIGRVAVLRQLAAARAEASMKHEESDFWFGIERLLDATHADLETMNEANSEQANRLYALEHPDDELVALAGKGGAR